MEFVHSPHVCLYFPHDLQLPPHPRNVHINSIGVCKLSQTELLWLYECPCEGRHIVQPTLLPGLPGSVLVPATPNRTESLEK